MVLKSLKKGLVPLALSGIILSSGAIGNSTVSASVNGVRPQREWQRDRDRRGDRDDRERARREERDEMARIRERDRDHQLRYRMNNRVRTVGYYDRWGGFHQYGYYDRFGFFHRY